MAMLVVFMTGAERAMHCADVGHDFQNQPKIFGSEEEKLLALCTELFHAKLYGASNDTIGRLRNRVYGIAKAHRVHITWYGDTNPCEPDRFLISHKDQDLAIIQC